MTLYSFMFVLIYAYGYRTITLEEALPTWEIGVTGGVIYFAVSYVVYFWLGNLKGVIFTFLAMVGLVIAFLLSVFNIGLEEIMQVEKKYLDHWLSGDGSSVDGDQLLSISENIHKKTFLK